MPDAQGNLQPGDPGYISPTSGLMNAGTATPGSQTPSPAVPASPPPVSTYQPAQATASVATATPTPYTPVTLTPDALAQTQLQKILASDSPLIQQAKQQGNVIANARGLLNSSLAAGASEQEMIRAATPIAQQDAATIAQSQQQTAGYANTSQQQTAAAQNTVAQQTAQLLTNTSLSNVAGINTALYAGMTAENAAQLQTALANLQSGTQIKLGTLNAQNQQLLQTNINAANMFSQSVAAIAQIQNNANLDAQAKSNNIQSILNMLNEGLRTTQSISTTAQADVTSLNLGQYFTNVTGLLQPIIPPAQPAPAYPTPPVTQAMNGTFNPQTGRYDTYDPTDPASSLFNNYGMV